MPRECKRYSPFIIVEKIRKRGLDCLGVAAAVRRWSAQCFASLRARSAAPQTTLLHADGAPGKHKSSSPQWKPAKLRRGTNSRTPSVAVITGADKGPPVASRPPSGGGGAGCGGGAGAGQGEIGATVLGRAVEDLRRGQCLALRRDVG